MIRNIRVVLDPPREQFGVMNPDPTDYIDFNVEFTSKFQYDFFYDLVKDRVVLIDRWEDGERQGASPDLQGVGERCPRQGSISNLGMGVKDGTLYISEKGG